MNNSEEIKSQNQFDCFVKMYAYLTDTVLENGGRRGERAVREALIKYSEDKGKALRDSHIEKGIDTNLASLVHSGHCCGEDPRFCRVIRKDTEQVQLYEVYSCPFEHVWRTLDASGATRNSASAGMFYCEECVHAVVRSYTEGRGQANLSDRLTCSRDTCCRFSLYLRPANLDTDQKERSFGERPAVKVGKDDGVILFNTEENFIKLFDCLLFSAKEVLGQQGASFIAVGLHRLAEDLADSLKLEADHLGRFPDREFMSEFFPLKLEPESGGLWSQCFCDDTKSLLYINLLNPLITKLKLTDA